MGRRKCKFPSQRPVCSVCYTLGPQFSLTPRCSSHSMSYNHTVCNLCLRQHVVTIISQDITNQVICPEVGCNAHLKTATIKAALLNANREDLWNDYELKSNWHGTSEQWIKRYAARCPRCLVPIEKNGGCNQVVCSQCHRVFNWQRVRTWFLYQLWFWWRTSIFLSPIFLYVVLIVILLSILIYRVSGK